MINRQKKGDKKGRAQKSRIKSSLEMWPLQVCVTWTSYGRRKCDYCLLFSKNKYNDTIVAQGCCGGNVWYHNILITKSY